MGHQNKLTMDINGDCLLNHVLHVIDKSCLDACHVVTGHEQLKVENLITSLAQSLKIKPSTSYNEHYDSGMASTITHGISKLAHNDAVVICLADMPNIAPDVIDGLVEAYMARPECSIFVPRYNKHRGNPVLINRRIFDDVLGLTGDTGVRSIMAAHPEWVFEMDTDCEGILQDVDSPSNLNLCAKER